MVYQVSYVIGRPSVRVPKPMSVDYIETEEPIGERQVRKFLRSEGVRGAVILSLLRLSLIDSRYFWWGVKKS